MVQKIKKNLKCGIFCLAMRHFYTSKMNRMNGRSTDLKFCYVIRLIRKLTLPKGYEPF